MNSMRVFLGGLNYRVTERDIDSFFRNYSGIGEIVIKNGFAFVEFDDRREAEDAIYEMNGRDLMGSRVIVDKATGTPRNSGSGQYYGGRDDRGGSYGSFRDRGGSRGGYGNRNGGDRGGMRRNMIGQRPRFPTRTQYRLIVTNLSSAVSWQDLKDFMRQAGEVTYADAHKNRKNEGVIEFATRSDMKEALMKMDDRELNGRRIKLYPEEREPEMRSPRGGRRESRSWSSRSRSRSVASPRSRSPISRSRSRSPIQKRGKPSKNRSSSRSSSPPPVDSPRKREKKYRRGERRSESQD